MFEMADTPWPRTGGDRGNRSNSRLAGPVEGRILQRVELWGGPGIQSVVVASDGSLRVTCGHNLFALSPEGDCLWSLPLAEAHSAPVALVGGRTLLTVDDAVWVVDGRGKRELTLGWEATCDDSGPSPNLSLCGEPIMTSPEGPVSVLRDWSWHDLGVFGYDVVGPAVYDDGSLAIAGYFGHGFCRVDTDGTILFRSGIRETDLLPCVNRAQTAAVGSLNKSRSWFFDPIGRELGSYPAPCLFAEYPGNQWVAAGSESLSRLTQEGEVVWRRELPIAGDWGLRQPLVDAEGHIYATLLAGVIGLDPDGKRLFQLQLGAARVGPPTIIAPGRLALLAEDELLLIG